MKVLYCNNKDAQYTLDKCQDLHNAGFDWLMCDFEPITNVPGNPQSKGIKVCYSIKLYTYPTIDEIESEICKAIKLGFDAIAFDLEAYDVSGQPNVIWHFDQSDYARSIRLLLIKYGIKTLFLYPEFLGGDKYKYYPQFIEVFKEFDVIVLFERTYLTVEPWNIIWFYYRNLLTIKRYLPKAKCIIGIWPDELKDWQAALQLYTVSMLSNDLFYYSEKLV